MNSLLRYLIKVPLVLPLPSGTTGSISFAIYHKVGGELNLEIDVPLGLFRRQMEYLAMLGRVVSFDKAIVMLNTGGIEGHYFVLTFDDGFREVYTLAYPILKELELPFIVYPTTRFLEESIPDDSSGEPKKGMEPLNWDMLGEMAESGLATIGAHSHSHSECPALGESVLRKDLERSHELFNARLGLKVRHFAYPRGLWSTNAEKIIASYYATAVIGGGKRMTGRSFNPLRISRIPVRRSDRWIYFLAKMRGWFSLEEDVYWAAHKLFC